MEMALNEANAHFGRFSALGVGFVVDDGHTALSLDPDRTPVEIAEEALDARLAEALPQLPALDGAPFASWVLARLACVARGTLGFEPALIEHCDDGVYVVDLTVFESGRAIAKLQLQGAVFGLGLLGVAIDAPAAQRATEALMHALLAEPLELAQIRVRVAEPREQSDENGPVARSIRAFGWDGHRFLGAETN